MKPGGRGCSRAYLPGINGLVALLVSQFCLNVRRQRHFTQPFQHLKENPLIVEFHHTVAGILHLNDSTSQLAVTENDLITNLHFPAGLAQALPFLVSQIPQQKHFHSAAGRTVAQETGRKHPGIVHYQAVTGLQIIKDIIKMLMGDLSGLPVQNTQPGAVPLLQRGLGDQLFRQVIPKIMGLQGIPSH